MRAWRTPGGIALGTYPPQNAHVEPTQLPCGGCLGCRQDKAKAWALRCHLELQQHRDAVFTTLTYDDAHRPPTLQKPELQRWLKRLRKAMGATRPIRFFASGEYGEKTQRPHYHAILYGMAEREKHIIEDTWGKGFTKTVTVTPAAIAYVAGYTSKKLGWKLNREERVWDETGEVYTWEPPFIQMSRRPGIGAHAKQWRQSWRSFAIHNGREMPVPRYLHEAWKAAATEQEIEQLRKEKKEKASLRDTSKKRREAAEAIAVSKQEIQAAKRKYA